MNLPQHRSFARDLSPMFLHPKKSSGTLWSRYPSGSVIIKFAQAIIVLLIFLTLYNTFPPHHQDVNLDIKQANAKDKKSTPFQGVLDFGHRLLNGTKSLNPQHLKGWTEWTVDPETGALTKNETKATGKIPEARRITAKELMSRPLPKDQTRAPKLLHQSWKDKDLPPKFQRWSQTCRRMNPDWEYVLWTDKDNLALVKKFLPWFKKPYRELTSEIYRADSVRNVYVGVFGGVYADLDTECTRPYDTLFSAYNISTAPYLELNETLPTPPSFPISSSDADETAIDTDINDETENENSTSAAAPTTPSITPPQTRKAFLGRMGTDPNSPHSIPNAWMASTPGHPFWLLPLQHIAAKLAANPFDAPEAITGPASLWETINEYNDLFHNTDFPTLDAHYAGSGWGTLYPPPIPAEELVILPFWAIYPFSWQRDGDAYKPHCLVGQESFDAARCKEVLGVEAWGSWSVTYWSHSWSQGGEQQHMDELQDKETIARKKAEKAEEEARRQEEIEEQEAREEKEWEQEMMGDLDPDDEGDDDEDEDDNGDDGWKGEEDDDIEDETLLGQELSELDDDQDDGEDDFALDNNPHHLPSSQQKSPPTTLKAPNPPNFGTIAEATQDDIPTNRVQKAAAATAQQQAVDEDDATIASAALAEEEQRRLDKAKQAKLQQAEDDLRSQAEEEELQFEEGLADDEEVGTGFDDAGGEVEELEELDELEENPYVGLLSRTRRLRRARRI